MTLPPPIVWPAASFWGGDDGNWSTFSLSVGTPPQQFYVFPSTMNSQSWIPYTSACSSYTSMPDCEVSRGIGEVNGSQSDGFQNNASSTWRQIGLYNLFTETSLYTDTNGLFGLDTLVVSNGTNTTSVANMTVAGMVAKEFWLGSLGLAAENAAFNVVNGGQPALIRQLQTNNLTSSISYGFTAGASYFNSPGKLVLGGYDSAAVKLDNTYTYNIPTGNSILATLASIQGTNTLLGTASLAQSTNGITMRIDTTIAQLWLPGNICDMMASAFGLTYDDDTNYYFINDTMHDKMLHLQPQLTFQLATGPSSSNTSNIVLPYAAFDHMLEGPGNDTGVRYFPLRRAANETQYVLGRAFMQEAYIIVDWERSQFRIGQATHATQQNITTIISPDYIPPAVPERGISTAAYAGIVVGVLILLLAAFACFYFWRRRQRMKLEKKKQALLQEETWSADEKRFEVDNTQVVPPEISGDSAVHEVGQGDMYELGQERKVCEADDTQMSGERSHERRAMYGRLHELDDDRDKTNGVSRFVYEMPGTPVDRQRQRESKH